MWIEKVSVFFNYKWNIIVVRVREKTNIMSNILTSNVQESSAKKERIRCLVPNNNILVIFCQTDFKLTVSSFAHPNHTC